MIKYEPIFNRDVVRAGDIVCRNAGGFIGHSIMWATDSLWNHDAIFIPWQGHLGIGDALMNAGCQLTVPFEWETRAIREGHKLIVLRPRDATAAQGEAAAADWMELVHGRDYDKVAIYRLLLKTVFGDHLPGQVGRPLDFFCSEGVAKVWKRRMHPSPWHPVLENETPGTTCAAWKAGQLIEPEGAFTEFGQRFRIRA